MEYWYARELQLVLDYKEWRKFKNVIKKTIDVCENSGISAFQHFVGADKMVQKWKFYQRNLTRKGNYSLNQTAKKAGVKKFDKFHNSGYKGLYNGGTMPEDLPTPKKSLKQLEKENKKSLIKTIISY